MYLKNKLDNLIKPQSDNEDQKRRELLLNALLFFSICGFVVLNIIRVIDFLTPPRDPGIPIIYTLLILLFFIFLWYLSRKGKIKTASLLLVITYSLPMFYSFLVWGADLPAAILLAVLIIALSGILLGTNLVLITTAIINFFLIILTYLHSSQNMPIDDSWRGKNHELGDAIAYAVLFLIIAIIVWLTCREIKRALERARKSEAELKEERDNLEIKIIERTEALHQAEIEKISQLYRLAEFGRLSSGIFHDLINPLTAISLNLEQISHNPSGGLSDAKSSLNQALSATHRMEGLVAGIKKQITPNNEVSIFSINEEIVQIIQLLSYKARRAGIRIIFDYKNEIKIQGKAIKLGQVITNLLANAIEASERKLNKIEEEPKQKEVIINLKREKNEIIIIVSDQGEGIAPENIEKIFKPFFSTKNYNSSKNHGGLGLGLSSSKNIIEKDFRGKITIQSILDQGTKFIISLPIK
ncbi:MAG: HAMP domain-containing sensor histidine kinase [Patescibacteria group bacterium]|jgi:signal transduction histidine kinase